jgi:hypothetical protein
LIWAAKRPRSPLVAQPALPLLGGGVSIRWAAPYGGGAASSAEGRDFLLSSERLRLVIGNDGDGIERHQRFGQLLQLAAPGDTQGELLELRTVVYVAGSPMPLRVLAVDVGRAGERPVPIVYAVSRDGRLELRTEYRLAPRQDYVELVSTVSNVSGKRIAAVQLGDHAQWPGTPAFAPRLGFVHVPTRADVPWLGRATRRHSYGFAFPERPAQTSFEFDVTGPAGELLLDRSADLEPGARSEFRRDAIAVEGGLGQLAQVAWQRLGKPFGFARGVLHPPQTWATVSARHPDGRTVLSVPAAQDGSFELPLPAGEYRFVLQAPGGEDEELGQVHAGAELVLNLVPPRPGTLSYLITDEREQPLAGRLVVRGVPPTKDPDLVPRQSEAGSKNMLYSLTGSGSLELPPGRYDVLASHGPEYSLPRQELEVNADWGATFRAVLARTVDTSGYLAGDFHVHASPSHDSNVTLTDRVLTLAAEGIELAVPTDHNHVTDYAEAISAQRLDGKLATMTGVEITTLNWGHFNAYPYAKSLEVPRTHETSPLEIFAVVRARAPQAVLQVNHPRMPGVGYFNRGELDTKTGVAQSSEFSFAFDTLEVTNGFDLEDPAVFERNLHEWFELLNVGRRYTAVGNSDSHHVVFQWAGWPRTYVRVPDQDLAHVAPLEVARALTSGHALVSCGIFVLPTANGSAGPGDTVQGSRVSLAISLRAPAWIDIAKVEVYANGAKVEERSREQPLGKPGWDLDVDLELKADAWIVVVARGNRFMNDALPGKWIKPFGFSNPIYVDADADGTFVSPGQ